VRKGWEGVGGLLVSMSQQREERRQRGKRGVLTKEHKEDAHTTRQARTQQPQRQLAEGISSAGFKHHSDLQQPSRRA
jgi:hypothetical protein